MAVVKGDSVVVYAYIGGQWKAWVCARNHTMETNLDFLEVATVNNGIWRTFFPTSGTWSLSLEGVVYLEMANTIALPDLRGYQITRTQLLVRIERTDEASNTYIDEGFGYIERVSDSSDYLDMNTFSVTLKGNGILQTVFTPTPINPSAKVLRLDYIGSAGEYSFASSAINLVDIVSVVVDGVECAPIITGGTPVNQEVKYTSSGGNGTLEFPAPLNAGTNVIVLYQEI